MKLIDAIVTVLKEADAPMKLAEIAKKALSGGLWQTTGKTPRDSVGAKIYTDIKRNGDRSLFIKKGKALFALNPRAAPRPAPREDEGKIRDGTPREQSLPCEDGAPAGYSFTDCAEMVLKKASSKTPMHYREITERALAAGWLKTKGKTPAATMSAQILTENNRRRNQGKAPRFSFFGKGRFGLSSWNENNFEVEIERHNQKTREELKKKLKTMKPDDFETLISGLLTAMGFASVEVTPYSGDNGINVRGLLVVGDAIRIKMAVQVKRWKKNVRAPTVQQIRGSLGGHEQGLIITTSDFSKGAKIEAGQPDKTPISLMNGDLLVSLLMEYGLGIAHKTYDVFDVDSDALIELSGQDRQPPRAES